MTAIENKIPDVSHLVKKTYPETKILDIESKYFTTADFNKFDAKIKKGLVHKSSISGFINKANLDKKEQH